MTAEAGLTRSRFTLTSLSWFSVCSFSIGFSFYQICGAVARKRLSGCVFFSEVIEGPTRNLLVVLLFLAKYSIEASTVVVPVHFEKLVRDPVLVLVKVNIFLTGFR